MGLIKAAFVSTLALIVLKLLGILTCSWIWIFAPIWLYVLIVVFVAAGIIFIWKIVNKLM